MMMSFPCAIVGTPAPPLIARHSRRISTSDVMSSASNSQPRWFSQSLASSQYGQVGVVYTRIAAIRPPGSGRVSDRRRGDRGPPARRTSRLKLSPPGRGGQSSRSSGVRLPLAPAYSSRARSPGVSGGRASPGPARTSFTSTYSYGSGDAFQVGVSFVTWLGLAAGLVIVAAAGALGLGALRWRRDTRGRVAELMRHRPPPMTPRAGSGAAGARVDGGPDIPDSVARFLRFSLGASPPAVRTVWLTQAGEFLLPAGPGGWRPFRARQWFSTAPPGFVWDASIRFLPGVSVRVRDAYIGGAGSMEGRLLGLVPVVSERGKPELSAAALQRYLAEAAWFPTALRPGTVVWTPLDDQRARATLADGGVEVSLEFEFDAEGRIVRVTSPARFREVKGTYVPTPWEGIFRSYEDRGGLRIPTEGEVAWIVDGERRPYWRGRLTAIRYAE